MALEGSAICKFCRRTFRNKQAVKAHLKGCIAYKEHVPRQSVRKAMPKAMPKAMNASLAENSRERVEMENSIRRREIIQDVIADVVEQDSRLLYDLPREAKAKVIREIQRELSPLPVSDFHFGDLLEIAERTKERICEPVFKAQDAAKRQITTDEEAKRRQKEEEEERALEREREVTKKARRREMLVASAIRYAERQIKSAAGMEIWHQWPAMNKVRGTIAREVVGTEPQEDIEKLVDEILIPFLEEGADRAEKERKIKLVEYGKKYTQEELDEEEDLNPFERAMTFEKVRQALEQQLIGDETQAQVEDLVEDLLDEELM